MESMRYAALLAALLLAGCTAPAPRQSWGAWASDAAHGVDIEAGFVAGDVGSYYNDLARTDIPSSEYDRLSSEVAYQKDAIVDLEHQLADRNETGETASHFALGLNDTAGSFIWFAACIQHDREDYCSTGRDFAHRADLEFRLAGQRIEGLGLLVEAH